jgi:hypothetical protein
VTDGAGGRKSWKFCYWLVTRGQAGLPSAALLFLKPATNCAKKGVGFNIYRQFDQENSASSPCSEAGASGVA